MPSGHLNIVFSRQDLQDAATEILRLKPDPIPKYRLMREVLRLPSNDLAMVEASTVVASSKWVMMLQAAQLADGSWGRFHSQDTKVKTVFRTTEEAIDRAVSLGLGAEQGVLKRVKRYIEKVLQGEARITDRDEKNPAWPLAIKFILAGRLSQIDSSNSAIEPYWLYLKDVATQAFASGNYRLEDEAAAYMRLSGIRWPEGFLESQHALWILSARPLPSQLEYKLMAWIWNKPDGIRYLRARLSEFQPRLIAYWLRSMNILTRFSCWREQCVDTLDQLWESRDQGGGWDFGSQIARCIDFPLSEDWRKSLKRRTDYSTCVLALLRRYFD